MLFSLTISTAGSMQGTGILKRILALCLTLYHGISADSVHTSDMDVNKIQGKIDPKAPVHSTRIRVGRSIDGFGLSPGITKDQRVGVEQLMSKAFANLTGDLAGSYYPLTGMNEQVRQQLVDDHFLFVSGDPNLKVPLFYQGYWCISYYPLGCWYGKRLA